MVIQFQRSQFKIFRWRLKLEEYDLTVEYRAGKKNDNADALSRIPPLDIKDLTLLNLNRLYNRNNSEYSTDLMNLNIANFTNSYEVFITKFNKSLILNDNVKEHRESIFSIKDNYYKNYV